MVVLLVSYCFKMINKKRPNTIPKVVNYIIFPLKSIKYMIFTSKKQLNTPHAGP